VTFEQLRNTWMHPDVWVPGIAAAVGASALAVGWRVGGETGFGIASGIVSVLGLVTSAFVARSI